MRIPLLERGRAKRASSADLPLRVRRFFRFQSTPKFRNPLPYPARIAVLSHNFSGQNLRVFESCDAESLQVFRPDILAGSLHVLAGLKSPVVVSKAVVVFSEAGGPFVTERERDWLWHRFAVPCFEQMLGSRGQVVAEECPVHSGLHVLAPEVFGTLTSLECDCGRTEPRLITTLMR